MPSCSMINGHIDRETNYERIMKMSQREFAEFLVKTVSDGRLCGKCVYEFSLDCAENDCADGIEQWLQEEVE